jgi:hypothetical protein
MLLAQNARRAESGWQLSESSYQSVAGTVDAAVVSHRFDRFDHFFCSYPSYRSSSVLCSLGRGLLQQRERERERERALQPAERQVEQESGRRPPRSALKEEGDRERKRKKVFFF